MYLGIDIGGTFIKYGLVNEDDQVIKKWKKNQTLYNIRCILWSFMWKSWFKAN